MEPRRKWYSTIKSWWVLLILVALTILRSSIIMYDLHEREFAIFRFFSFLTFSLSFPFIVLSGCWCLKEGIYVRGTMRMLSRSAQNWNQEFTFDSELAEISGVQNRGIPLFLFFLRSTLAVYIGVIHLFRARSLMPVANSKQEGTRKTRRKRSQQYIIIKLTAIPTIFCSLLSLRFRYIYIYIHILIYYFSVILIIFHFTILLWLLIKLY